jgi:hypothetical protein
MKRCTKCGIKKDESEFCRHKYNKDGLNSRCKKCAADSSRLWYVKNQDKIGEKNRLRYAENIHNAATDTPDLRTIKVCPSCHNRSIYKRKNLMGYYCQICKTSFQMAATTQIVDNRNSRPVPRCLIPPGIKMGGIK